MNIYNSEMYPDPTAYHALTKIQKEEKAARYRPLVYICSPYSGDIADNARNTKTLSGKNFFIREFDL